MKPKHLSFFGINSFSRSVEIDFERLLSGGLFGIFGDTGSGKTTILDSMIFALYGRIDRARGGAGSEIINYNCDKASVTFDFETETQEGRKVYRIEREIRRKNSAQSLMLSEVRGDKVLALSDGVRATNEKIEQIVGLTFEDFKKCIALPQGEFAQFVRSDRSDRLKLISRLFGLDRYGDRLYQKVRERSAEAGSVCERLKGELRGYEDAGAEKVKEYRERRELLAARREEAEKEKRESAAAFEKIKASFARAQKYFSDKRELERKLSESEDREALRGKLARHAAAAEACRLDEQIQKRAEYIGKAKEALARAVNGKKKAEEELSALAKKYAGEDFSRAQAAADAQMEQLLLAQGEAEKLNDLRSRREELGRQYRAAEAAKRESRARLDELAAREKLMEDGGAASAAVFLSDNLESALLADEFSREIEYFTDKQRALHDGFVSSALFDAVDKELSVRIEYFKKRLTREKSADAAVLLEKWREEQRTQEKRAEALRRISAEHARAEQEWEQAEKDLARTLEEGTALKGKIEEGEKRILSILGAEDAPDIAKMRAACERERALLAEGRRRYETRTAELNSAVRSAASDIARAEEQIAQGERANGEELSRLAEQLASASFADVSEARELLRSLPDVEAAKKSLKEYDDALLLLRDALRRTEEEGPVEPVSEEEHARLEKRKEEAEKQAASLAEAFAVCSQELARTEERSKKKSALQRELGRAEEKRDLLARLLALVRGNSLTEFVAGEYLSDISSAATRTLLDLTGGRYFVRYKDGGFVIGDNLCGGELRSVSTLSGGETFLVSLSLALALSEAIHAKSLRPIEFFFLDEGFGTLDEKLVDTVMDSLEKLRCDNFSIGLISHVEELKHRIGNKIMVTGAADGGSSSVRIIIE